VEYVEKLHTDDNGVRIDAINMSLMTDAQFSGLCDDDDRLVSFNNACRAAREAGIAIFAASGNLPPITQLSAPACFSSVYSVGSVDVEPPDAISFFTSRNELLDLLAPGQLITSTGLGGGTLTFSGTSQASPHVAALACLLRQIDRELGPSDMLALMKKSGVPIADSVTGLTFPRIDALAAVEAVRARQFFVRADCNGDGRVDIADAVFLLLGLFGGRGESLSCRGACDGDDNGELNISDAVFILGALFLGEPMPPPPFPDCGVDPTPDALGCERSPCM
jgi:hypothetical protein